MQWRGKQLNTWEDIPCGRGKQQAICKNGQKEDAGRENELKLFLSRSHVVL